MNNRIVIIVSNGVADWIADNSINVMLIDTDNLTLDKDDIEDFNDLIPDWIKEQIRFDRDGFEYPELD